MTDDAAMMSRFARDYLDLLDHRLEAIRRHLSTGNFMTAHIALLSLESTSVMVGAADLGEVAGRLRAAVEQGDREAMPELLTAVEHEAELARARLRPPA